MHEKQRSEILIMSNDKRIFLHLGARGNLGPALELVLRRNPEINSKSGLTCPVEKVHKPVLRELMSGKHFAGETKVLEALGVSHGSSRVFISNQHAWASPPNVLDKGDVYPQATKKCTALATAFPTWHVVLMIEIMPIHELLLSFENEQLNKAIKATDWADLYEFSWSELVKNISQRMPSISIEIIPRTVVPYRLAPILELVSGLSFPDRLNNEYHLAFHMADPIGRKLLKGLLHRADYRGKHLPDAELRVVTQHFSPHHSSAEANALGLDSQTRELFDLSYQSDLEKLRGLERVRIWN